MKEENKKSVLSIYGASDMDKDIHIIEIKRTKIGSNINEKKDAECLHQLFCTILPLRTYEELRDIFEKIK